MNVHPSSLTNVVDLLEDEVKSLRAEKAKLLVELDVAKDKAKLYEKDWYEAKCEFGTAMAKWRDAIRGREKESLEAVAELDEAMAALRQVKAWQESYADHFPTDFVWSELDAVLSDFDLRSPQDPIHTKGEGR